MNTMLCSISACRTNPAKRRSKNALGKLEGINEVGVNMTTGTVKVD
jgi:hypothetical protein